jgi:hypothetical protein
MAFAVRIKQNYKLIPEKSLVGLAVSQYDADTVEFVQYLKDVMAICPTVAFIYRRYT